MHLYSVLCVGAQPDTITVLGLGHCKVPVPALGKFIPIVAPPWHDHLALGIELVLGTQFWHGAPNASTASPFWHGVKMGANSPSANTQ